MFEQTLAKLDILDPLIQAVGREEITSLSKFLYERVAHPDYYLVFLGETSCGKSSIINGLIGQHCLPVKACPSTAAITEVELLSNESENKYLAIYKNAAAEAISEDVFLDQAEHPSANLNRLRLSTYSEKYKLNGLRIFDTPGYGSIIETHDEVLKEFLPNSDIVIYTVLYRNGIQDEDYVFLSHLKSLIRDDVEIILVINRCPRDCSEKDRRITEITKYAEDILSKAPRLFCIEDTPVCDGEIYALPQCEDLWMYVQTSLCSEERLIKLENIFNQYINDLYIKCDSIIQARYAAALLSDTELNEILDMQKESARRIRLSINELVIPTFDSITQKIPQKINEAKTEIFNKLNQSLDNSSKSNKEEMVAYTNAHLMPYTIQKVCGEYVMDYIDVVLTDLNNRVDDYIQKEVIHFESEIEVKLTSNLSAASAGVANKILQKLTTNGLSAYFFQFGGAGGANAGIANAASHLLKKAGNLFGKTFSRETHNALKHFLKKIGATSMKAIGAAIAVVTEALYLFIDYETWKPIFRRKVKKGIEEWGENSIPLMLKDINSLRDKNIETINKVANEIENTFEAEASHDADNCKKDVILSEMIAKQLSIIN